MKTMHKFLVAKVDWPVVRMPRGAIPKAVGMQNGAIWVWALVNTNAPVVTHLFAVRGTGHEITPEVEQGDFLGTVFDGIFVWHILSLGDIGL